MAILGRSIPIRSHRAAPIVAPGGPRLVTRATSIQTKTRDKSARVRAVPQVVTAPPIVGPPITTGVLPPAVIVGQARRLVGRSIPRPHVAPPIVGAPVAAAVLPPAIIVGQARQRALVGRTVPHPHVAPPIVAPGGPVVAGRTEVTQARQRALVGRTRPLGAHVAPPNLTASTAPPVPPGLIIGQAKGRALVGRTCPRPHVAPPNLAPSPFRPATVVTTARRARPPQPPAPHRAPPTLTQPITPPFPPGSVITQARQRALVGRTIPRPHTARPNLAPQPFRPAVVVGQAKARALVGRRLIEPHLAPALVGAPLGSNPVFTGILTATRTDSERATTRTDPIRSASTPAERTTTRYT